MIKINKRTEFNADLKQVYNYVVKLFDLPSEVQVNLNFISEEEIKQLNKETRNIDKVTDVISFALEDGENNINFEFGRLLGDIYICVDKMKEQALEYGHSQTREMGFLTVHGLLHLLGYDHMTLEEEKIMFEKQELILDEYGLKR